jgi:dTDP-4-amino-4,6-dideoxygalactose transaminase
MKSEIGSFIEIDEEKTDQKQGQSVVTWLEQRKQNRSMQLLCSGREAIEAAICDIEQKSNRMKKVCLLPQYICDTVIIPFVRHQWKIFFYPVELTLNVDIEEFEKIIKNEKPSVVLIHPYYGMGVGEDVRNIIQSYRTKEGLICIEDSTQSLARFGECAEVDYYVVSLRKWFDIPDGGVILSEHQIFLRGGTI